MIESNLVDLLRADATVTSIAADRIYPVLLPDESTLPAITYQVIATTPLYALDERINLTRYRIQIDAWAKWPSYAQAKSLAEAIRVVLDGYSGPRPDGSRIDSIIQVGATDLFEPSGLIHRVMAEYIIQFAA